MKHSTAADTVGYQLYQGSNYAIVWGDATGGSPMAGLGTGAAQSYTVYGLSRRRPRPGRAATAIPSRPPSHSEPAPGQARRAPYSDSGSRRSENPCDPFIAR